MSKKNKKQRNYHALNAILRKNSAGVISSKKREADKIRNEVEEELLQFYFDDEKEDIELSSSSDHS